MTVVRLNYFAVRKPSSPKQRSELETAGEPKVGTSWLTAYSLNYYATVLEKQTRGKSSKETVFIQKITKNKTEKSEIIIKVCQSFYSI